jgi:hypothetical protein
MHDVHPLGLPIQRDRQGVGIDPCGDRAGIRDHRAEYRDWYLGSIGNSEIALLADAVAVATGSIEEQLIRNGLGTVAQAPRGAVAMGAAIDGHGKTGDRRVTGDFQRAVAGITQVGIDRVGPGRTLRAEIQQTEITDRTAGAVGNVIGHCTTGDDGEPRINLPAHRRLRLLSQQ